MYKSEFSRVGKKEDSILKMIYPLLFPFLTVSCEQYLERDLLCLRFKDMFQLYVLDSFYIRRYTKPYKSACRSHGVGMGGKWGSHLPVIFDETNKLGLKRKLRTLSY